MFSCVCHKYKIERQTYSGRSTDTSDARHISVKPKVYFVALLMAILDKIRNAIGRLTTNNH